MDDRQLLAEPVPSHSVEKTYRCPGESHDIDRAVHRGRLAAFFPACRDCVHRADMDGLTELQISQWAEVLSRSQSAPRFTAEGLECDSPNSMSTGVVRRYCGAIGAGLWRDRTSAAGAPAVLVASDGHWATAELLSAACDALQVNGCRAIEAGALVTASVATAARCAQADAALWIGNASGKPHAMALRLWGGAGRPWSSPGGLDVVREIFERGTNRPKRHGGGLERLSGDQDNLAPLANLFHALRPLRFVVDTVCEPWLRQLHALTRAAACEVLRPADLKVVPASAPVIIQASFVDRRLDALARQVLASGSHFGIWIDGGGAACRLVDERGAVVGGQRLCRLLAAYVCREQPGATIVLEPAVGNELARAVADLGARVITGGATRETMCAAIESSGAVFAGGASGEFWFAGQPPVADALLATGLLLTILSQSDRPVSEVLDAA